MLQSERAFAGLSGAATSATGASWPCRSAATYAVDPYCATSRVVTVPSRALDAHESCESDVPLTEWGAQIGSNLRWVKV